MLDTHYICFFCTVKWMLCIHFCMCGSLYSSWQICLDLLTIRWEAEAYLLITACHQTPLVPQCSDCSLPTRWSLQQEQQRWLVNEKKITVVIIRTINLLFCNLHQCYKHNTFFWAVSIVNSKIKKKSKNLDFLDCWLKIK